MRDESFKFKNWISGKTNGVIPEKGKGYRVEEDSRGRTKITQETVENQKAEVEQQRNQQENRIYVEIVKGGKKEKTEQRNKQEEHSVGETIFVLNLPQNMSAKEAWNYFDKQGNIRDINLPKKR